MADDGGGAVQEEIGRDMVEGQRKMSEPAQPANNHQTQKSEASKKSLKKKVEVLLKAAGDAPIMVKKKWVVDGSSVIYYRIY
ncbi:unnamed protein product [Pocillopora meandrina]|uniref:Ubiquitin-like protein ATG12 n=1 Tax=Pocillopora meandrina TaxID=46732 RepID=A0AAU9XJH6_9CNID|nr:unnamed protein product [Pocillopora meandrina]